MTTSAHSPRGTASDSLLLQVNSDNILQVRNAYLAQQERLDDALRTTRNSQSLTGLAPGQDPISTDYAPFFNRRIAIIGSRFEAHAKELREATNRLGEAAREYGLTEGEIEQSFRDFQSRTAGAPGPRPVVDR